MRDLKPCPFCGSEKLEIYETVVRCTQCGTDGPYYNKQAIDRGESYPIIHKSSVHGWNTRDCWIKVSDMPIPDNETVIMGLWLRGKKIFEQYILYFDSELGELQDGDNYFSAWELSDFEYWQPLPEPPEVSE